MSNLDEETMLDAYYMGKVRTIVIAIDGLMSKMRMSFEKACSVFDLTEFRMSDIKRDYAHY
jgi:hypothetical protein